MTTRTLEEVFWLHPLLCSQLAPVNREARRVVEAKRPRLRTKLERLVASANRRRPESQPKLTVEEAEKLAEDCVSSALARAHARCAESGLPPVEVFAVVVMSNHLHLVVRAPGKNLAAFMGYFLARVAQSLNLLLGRVGPVFPRRYDAAQPILDEEGAAGRVTYVLENPNRSVRVATRSGRRASMRIARCRHAAYDVVRALAKIGERVEWPEGMYAPGGAVAA